MSRQSEEILLQKAREFARRRRALRCLTWAVNALFYSLVLCLGLALASQFVRVGIPGWLYAVIVIIGSCTFAVGLGQAPDCKRSLMEVDRKYDLRDRLTTAYEVFLQGAESVFAQPLLDDAAGAVRSIKASDVYPWAMPPRGVFLPFLVVGVLVLATVNLNMLGSGRARVDLAPEVERGLAELRELGDELAARAEEHSLPESLRIAQELQRLPDRLQGERIGRQDLSEEMAAQADRMSMEIEKLAEEIMPESEAGQQQYQQRLQELMARYSDEGIEPERRERNDDGQTATSAVRDNFGRVDSEQQDEQTQEHQSAVDEEMDRRLSDLAALMRLREDLQRGQKSLAEVPLEQDSLDVSEQDSETDDSSTQGPEVAGGQAQATQERYSASAGSRSGVAGGSSVPDERAEHLELPQGPNRGQTSQLRGEVQDQGTVQALIRALPQDSVSVLTREEITVDYEKQIESMMSRETVPLHLRDSIRDYFLRIGAIGKDEQ